MLKAFCDSCGNECVGPKSGTRRFDVLKNDLGFEVIPLRNAQVSQSNHVCDNCLSELLITAAKTFVKAPIVIASFAALSDAQKYATQQRVIKDKLDGASEKEKAAEAKLAEAKQFIADAERQKQVDDERIAVLSAQVRSLTARNNTEARLKLAAEAQAEIDAVDNPTYTENVQRRERLRASST